MLGIYIKDNNNGGEDLKEFYDKYFMKQKMMYPVLHILGVLAISSIYQYGWRSLVLLVINSVVAVIVEFLSSKYMFGREKVSEGAFVTSLLYTMTLPVSIPLWISALGMVFGVFFGKMVFGGFGRNIFNPALVGRVFVYINFPNPMTIHWNKALSGLPGGFAHYITPIIDDLSSATPMIDFKNNGVLPGIGDLILGKVPGVSGEAMKVIILIGAIYLIYKKVASWEIMAGSVVGFAGLSLILSTMGFEQIADPISGMLMGGFLFGTVLMATDPVSASKTVEGKWIYGIVIGLVTVIIRGFALFSGGMMFAILIGNTFAPIVDYGVRALKNRKKAEVQA